MVIDLQEAAFIAAMVIDLQEVAFSAARAIDTQEVAFGARTSADLSSFFFLCGISRYVLRIGRTVSVLKYLVLLG